MNGLLWPMQASLIRSTSGVSPALLNPIFHGSVSSGDDELAWSEKRSWHPRRIITIKVYRSSHRYAHCYTFQAIQRTFGHFGCTCLDGGAHYARLSSTMMVGENALQCTVLKSSHAWSCLLMLADHYLSFSALPTAFQACNLRRLQLHFNRLPNQLPVWFVL